MAGSNVSWPWPRASRTGTSVRPKNVVKPTATPALLSTPANTRWGAEGRFWFLLAGHCDPPGYASGARARRSVGLKAAGRSRSVTHVLARCGRGRTRSAQVVVGVHNQRLSGANPQRAARLPARITIRRFGLSVVVLPGLVLAVEAMNENI